MQRVNTEAERIAALLHDVVEDTDWTLDRLREAGYSEEIITAVDCLTRRGGETYEAFVLRCKADPIALGDSLPSSRQSHP